MRPFYLSNDRLRLAIACVVAGFAAAELAAAEFVPYEARVVAPRVQVRSGPGENFYPTETLAQDETVDVYREESSGWLAIRPPQGSFSWVFGRHLKVRDGDLAVVDKEEVASRIGSRLSDKRNATQVRLRKGEVVEIIGEETSDGATWYKVTPPAGEFRWIHATSVQTIGPLAVTPEESEAEQVVVPAAATQDDVANDDETIAPAAVSQVAASQAAPGENWRAPSTGGASAPAEVVAPPLADVSATPAPPITPAKTGGAPAPAAPATTPLPSTVPPAPLPVPNPPPPSTGNVPDALARQLTDIELRLSRMVAAPPNQWNTVRLERDTEQLLAQAQTAAERDAVKVTLAKVDQFKSIGQRHQQATSPNTVAGLSEAGAARTAVVARSPDPATGLTAGLPASAGSGDPRRTVGDLRTTASAGRYDATGILRPVVSKRPGAPQFALVDERGQVISFVTPTPDVNLQPYLGRRVGVIGNRGFIAEFNRAHVTADRVLPLDERMMR